MENRDNVKEKEEKEVFVLELLSEIKRQSKRWMIAFFVVLALWAATIAGFVFSLISMSLKAIRRTEAAIITSTLASKEML